LTSEGLNSQLRAIGIPLQRQIAATDNQIDHLVNELYGLTEEEIRAVNGSAG